MTLWRTTCCYILRLYAKQVQESNINEIGISEMSNANDQLWTRSFSLVRRRDFVDCTQIITVYAPRRENNSILLFLFLAFYSPLVLCTCNVGGVYATFCVLLSFVYAPLFEQFREWHMEYLRPGKRNWCFARIKRALLDFVLTQFLFVKVQ